MGTLSSSAKQKKSAKYRDCFLEWSEPTQIKNLIAVPAARGQTSLRM